MQSNISALQRIILNNYKEFKRICEKYGLRYYAIGGTCIGAVRHQGFVPWDDDMDVAMPLDDFLEFRNVAPLELSDPYELFDIDEHKHCAFRFLKLINQETTFIENGCEPYPDRYCGVFLDIMPLCGAPNDPNEREKYLNFIMQSWRKNIHLRFPPDYFKTIKSRAYSLITIYRHVLMPFYYYTRKVGRICKKYSFDSSDNTFFIWRRNPNRMFFLHRDFADYIDMPFEDTMIRVPVGYDSYLKADFGDYMTLPPEEERHLVHQAAILDLNRSYKEYIKERNLH